VVSEVGASRLSPYDSGVKGSRRRTIIRVVALLLAWLVAGATLNVAVAWGFVYWPVGLDYQSNDDVPPADIDEMTQLVPPGWTMSPWFDYRVRTWCVNFDNVGCDLPSELDDATTLSGSTVSVGNGPIMPRNTVIRLQAGWPMKSLQWSSFGGSMVDSLPYTFQTSVVVKNRRLPTGMLPIRFAINTLFYAGVLWVLCCGPFALRRMIRRRRGRCPNCSYPIGQSPVCTECGAPHAAVTPKAVQS